MTEALFGATRAHAGSSTATPCSTAPGSVEELDGALLFLASAAGGF